MSKHMKRLTAPTSWPVSRKSHVWVTKPAPGPHPVKRSMPLLVVVRDLAGYCDTAREARRIIGETSPGAIVAVACERDLITGIQDVAPKIPVIGLPNSRPEGPCADTVINTEELQQAIDFFRSPS